MNYRNTAIVAVVAGVLCILLFRYLGISLWWMVVPALMYVSLLVAGAIFIQGNFFIPSVNSLGDFYKSEKHHVAVKKEICLTFDDGIHPENTALTLNILKQKNIPAHFFIIGKNIAGNENLLKRMYEEGHLIGNHSMYHRFNFDMQSAAEMKAEIEQTNRLIEDCIGVKPLFFRPPYGVTNPNLAKAVKQTGMLSIGWNIRSLDTMAKSKSELLEKLVRKTRPGAIVLLHDRCRITVDTLTDYIDYCVKEGYTFATLTPAYES